MGNQITHIDGQHHWPMLLAASDSEHEEARITATAQSQPNFIDLTAQLADLRITLPNGKRFEVKKDSHTLAKMRDALGVLREAVDHFAEPASEQVIHEQASALALLLRLDLIGHFLLGAPIVHGDQALMPLSPDTPCWLAQTFMRVQEHVASKMKNRAPSAPCATTAPPALHLAVINGKVPAVKRLATPDNLAQRDTPGRSALDVAIENNKQGAVNALLEVWRDLNVPGYRGLTPLSIAARFGRLEIMQSLIGAGADVNIGGKDSAPIHHAIAGGAPKAVDLLCRHGADPRSVADYAQFKTDDSQIAPGEAHLTPMALAVLSDQVKMVNSLRRAGVTFDEAQPDKAPLLSMAAAVGNLDLFNLILANGGDPQATDSKGRTALMWAAAHGRPAIMQRLVSKGGRCDDRDNQSQTLLHLAADGATEKNETNKQAVLALLLARPETNANARNSKGQTALHVACGGQSGEVVATLLRAKPRPNLEIRDNNGRRALHNAAESNNLIAVHELLKLGAQIEATDNMGNTSLVMAAGTSALDAAEELLEHGANPNWQNANGASPLHAAVAMDNADMFNLLLAHKADPDARSALRLTPLELAHKRKAVQILASLANTAGSRGAR